MLQMGIKVRHARHIDVDANERSKPRSQTVKRYEAPKWQRDNKYILSGYRREQADCFDVLTSLTFLHNETCNIYSHLVGAAVLPLLAATTVRSFWQYASVAVSKTDYIMFGVFFGCAECCLLLSTAYHLLSSHSHHVDQLWHRMDLLGIVIATVGTFIPGIHYIFVCEPMWQAFHWFIVSQIRDCPQPDCLWHMLT